MPSWSGALVAEPGDRSRIDRSRVDRGPLDHSHVDRGPVDPERLSDAELMLALEEGFALKRQADAWLARLAGQVAHRSRSSLGPEALAIKAGSGSAASLLTEVGQISLAEAGRLCRVGEATAARVGFLGEPMPALYPILGAELDAGRIPVDSAQWIVTSLSQASPRAHADDLIAAEQALVEFACENPADMVRKLAIRWRDALDADGIEPREEVLVARRSLRRTDLANGMRRYLLELDPAGSAFLDTAIDALVGAALRVPRFEAAPSADQCRDDQCGDDQCGDDQCGDDHEVLPDDRSIAQIGADAFVDLARHCLSCSDSSAPLASATVVVRMTLDSLLSGLGEARLDGVEQPISARTARRMAADAGIIPMVLGGQGEVLDLGVSRRLFTRSQRIALAERDDGCAWANCRRPPSYTEAHHIHWWSHGGGTDLENGVLLCSMHHHRIHRDGWTIRVTGNVPWFIPPSNIDSRRKPRRGGRLSVLPESVGERMKAG